MDDTFLLRGLGLTLLVVVPALIYLRGMTRRVLLELCHTEAGVDFWLRSADLLALAGSLILVLGFGTAAGGGTWAGQARATLLLALAGLFITVLIVASMVWRNVPRDALGQPKSAEVARAAA